MILKSKISEIRKNQPLIHCITNHISINDCANAVLAMGAKPIMAEHPEEVSEITSRSAALAVNLGNISDARMKSIFVSGKAALEKNIPCVIDIVGVACSNLRLTLAKRFIDECKPLVIKGNESEIKALCDFEFNTKGIDSQENSNDESLLKIAKTASEKLNTVVLISGKTDAVSDGKKVVLVRNGSHLMPLVTGTGCVQGTVCGAYLSVADPFSSAVSSAVTLGLAGEYAHKKFDETNSISTFHGSLIDALFLMNDEYLINNARIEVYE